MKPTIPPPDFSTIATPERLNLKGFDALWPMHAPLGTPVPLLDDDDYTDHTIPRDCFVEIAPTKFKAMALTQVAILNELLRFKGMSLAVNSNGNGRDYLKLVTPVAKDNMPVARLWVDAGEYVAVAHPAKAEQQDNRPEVYGTFGAGKPKKDARSTAINHAYEACLGDTGDKAFADFYRANLRALFQRLDQERGRLDVAA